MVKHRPRTACKAGGGRRPGGFRWVSPDRVARYSWSAAARRRLAGTWTGSLSMTIREALTVGICVCRRRR